jgi:heptosyltransferase-2
MLTELCTKIDHPVILIGGPEDRANGEQIAAADPVKIYNACGKFNLHESADLVKRAKLVISHDTGMMHIAAAFRKPIISIWGNTVPAFGMTPYYGSITVPNHISQAEKLWCRPCSKIGYNKCPLGHFDCMKRQSINALLTKVNEMLGR